MWQCDYGNKFLILLHFNQLKFKINTCTLNRASIWGNETVLELVNVNGCTTLLMYLIVDVLNATELYILHVNVQW